MERVDVARGPLLRSGDAQDYWGCDEQAGHRGPSRWGLPPAALPLRRTNPGRLHSTRHWRQEPPGVEPPFRAEGALSKYCPF